jgi:hypothetical protein
MEVVMQPGREDKGYVIKADAAFYDGRGAFVDEYPDAKVYRREPSAKEVRRAFWAATEMGFNGTSVDVIQNYGFESERIREVSLDIDAVREEMGR